MVSNFEILNSLYRVLNVASLSSEITGKITKVDIPRGSQNEDVIINVLTNQNGYVKNGFANVNIYVPRNQHGIDFKRFKEIRDVVTPLIDDVNTGTYRLQIQSESGPFLDKENNRDSMYFYNIRVNYQTI